MAVVAAAVALAAGCGDGRPRSQATDGTDGEAASSSSSSIDESTSITGSGSDPVAASTGSLPPPEVIDPAVITARASSVLPGVGDLTYAVENLFDGDPSTAWNHDNTVGRPEAQFLTFEFAQPVELTEIRIVNGYVKSDDVFQGNHRVRELTVTTDQPEVSITLELADQQAMQSFARTYGIVRTVRLGVDSIYPGSRYQDLAITAIEFIGRPATGDAASTTSSTTSSTTASASTTSSGG